MVTEAPQLVGVISPGDIIKKLLSDLDPEKAVPQDIYTAAY